MYVGACVVGYVCRVCRSKEQVEEQMAKYVRTVCRCVQLGADADGASGIGDNIGAYVVVHIWCFKFKAGHVRQLVTKVCTYSKSLCTVGI